MLDMENIDMVNLLNTFFDSDHFDKTATVIPYKNVEDFVSREININAS